MNMNIKNLLFFTFCVSLSIASATVIAQNLIPTNNRIVAESGNSMNNNNYTASTNWQYSSSSQRQDTVNFNSTPAEQPYLLSVSANTTTQLTGQIFVNGVVVRQIKQNKTLINLSPYFSKGRQKIEISGSYKPASSSVLVELSGPGTQVTQQTGGNGRLTQSLMIDVR
jgi:hypothetical protein